MSPLQKFLQDVSDIHSSHSAVDETSYYGAIETLFNDIGERLKPRVRCILHPKDRGAGLPDGGLFTADQFEKKKGSDQAEPKESQLPSRGAIEVKPSKEDVKRIAASEQAERYLSRYGQLLITNLRQFVLVGHDLDGNPKILESYEFADEDASFWTLAAHPRRTSEAHGTRFSEYLKRVMLHAAPLVAPGDVASFLASYARDALARIEGIELDALIAIRGALEEALGLKFEGKKGEHFFRSSLVQTLFYGVFSAWVLWARRALTAKGRFSWSDTARLLKVPVIRKLFHEMADPGQLEELNLTEVLDWTAAVLNRVDRAAFFSKFEESQAVQYFYEPFLEEFDPELRKELGVWYTPREIVKYMVERVDTVLREELDLPDGLADKNVYVLDPCCGTGSYLVEVLKKIHETLSRRGGDALIAADLKEAAQTRLFGFEILPAPFIVSHLQLGLLLQNLGTPLVEKGEDRIGVYLTNALTGWEPPKGEKKQLAFKEFGEERDAAERVKRDTPILVILGNPPYNAFAGVSPTEEHGLVEPYKQGLVSEWKIRKFNLDDLYIRFFRLAERRVAEMTGRGIVSYISNHSWISDPSFVVLRQHLLQSFDRFWIENMHGNRKISEYAPDGRTSETVFAVPGFSVGIQQGVAISLWVKSGREKGKNHVLFRDDINDAGAVERREHLLQTLSGVPFTSQYQAANPRVTNRYSFRPDVIAPSYLSWPALPAFTSRQPFAGISEDRRKALISIDREPLRDRMMMYFDPEVEWAELQSLGTCLTENVPRFNARAARTKLINAEKSFEDARLIRYSMRPFDLQWCYYSPVRPLWREPRPEYWSAYEVGSPAIVSRFKAAKDPEGPPITFAKQLCDYHMMSPNASIFPLTQREPSSVISVTGQTAFPSVRGARAPNLSHAATAYLTELGLKNWEADANQGALIWIHALAVAHSPRYLVENNDGIRQDWPRIPLPKTKEGLESSAGLGTKVAALLDTGSSVNGVTAGNIRPELRMIGTVTRLRGGNLTDTDLLLDAGWGHAGRGGVTMPGKGKLLERDYTSAEREFIVSGAHAVGSSEEQIFDCLGEKTCDVFLNRTAFWSNIPSAVWDYTIGGYQVIKKWLSYREGKMLGRSLTKEEVRYVQEMVRRIAAILLLAPALDANYSAIKANTFAWPPNSTRPS